VIKFKIIISIRFYSVFRPHLRLTIAPRTIQLSPSSVERSSSSGRMDPVASERGWWIYQQSCAGESEREWKWI